MKIIVYLISLVLINFSTALSDINRIISDFEIERAHGNIGGKLPFLGSFEFETLPEPLKPVRVKFHLSVNDTSSSLPVGDWEIRLLYSSKVMKLLSDSVFYWQGFHDYGDQYSNYIEFVPLCSGTSGFSLHLHGTPTMLAVGIQYSFDIDGKLISIEKASLYPVCNSAITTFFDQDSVRIIKKTNPTIGPEELFLYTYVVKPPFHIGDTSTITYNLVALHDAPEGVDYYIRTKYMELESWPERISQPVYKGDTLELKVKVIPTPIKEAHEIIISLNDGNTNKREIKSSFIKCSTVFKNDSTLAYITDKEIYEFEEERLPSIFPSRKKDTYDEYIHISFDEDKKIDHRKYK